MCGKWRMYVKWVEAASLRTNDGDNYTTEQKWSTPQRKANLAGNALLGENTAVIAACWVADFSRVSGNCNCPGRAGELSACPVADRRGARGCGLQRGLAEAADGPRTSSGHGRADWRYVANAFSERRSRSGESGEITVGPDWLLTALFKGWNSYRMFFLGYVSHLFHLLLTELKR